MENDFKSNKPAVKTIEELSIEFHYWKEHALRQFKDNRDSIDIIKADLKKNTDATLKISTDIADIKTSTADVVDYLQAMRTGRKIVGGVGAVAMWVVSVAATVAMLVQAFKGKLW